MGNESFGHAFRMSQMPLLRGLRIFAIGFYKNSAPDGASAAVTNDDAISTFSDEMPTGDNGGNREIISTFPGSLFEKSPLSPFPPVRNWARTLASRCWENRPRPAPSRSSSKPPAGGSTAPLPPPAVAAINIGRMTISTKSDCTACVKSASGNRHSTQKRFRLSLQTVIRFNRLCSAIG